MTVTIYMTPHANDTLAVVIAGVLAETMDKQARRIAELEASARNHRALELRALRLSIKPRKKI